MDTEKQYIQGFNNGYTLAKYEPDLMTKIIKNIHPTNDYLDGLFSGKVEYELEHTRTQLDDLKRVRNESQNRENDLERDI